MTKYFGEMTKDEFNAAIKEIFAYKKNSDTPKKTCNDYIKDKQNEVCNLFQTIKNIILFKELKDFLSTPCTKEVFVSRGIKTKLFLAEVIDTVVFVVVAVIILKYCVAEIRWIPSGSMKPTLIEGDRVVVERFSRFNQTPKRGDIMVFYPPFEKLENTPIKIFQRLTGFFCKDVAYIKRVIGLPGEKFEIKQNEVGKYYVYINDIPLEEPYVKNAYEFSPCVAGMYCGPMIIPENQYLMLGDNRGNSKDSRYWGLLPKDKFIGNATHVFRFKTLTMKNYE